MPRPIGFVPQEVLEKAMVVFWRHGYEATTLDELTRAMGVNRPSLYNTFGNKQDLFHASFEHYVNSVLEPAIRQLHAPGSASQNIKAAFNAMIGDHVADTDRRGCFLLNAGLEMPNHAPQTVKRISETFLRIEEALYGAIIRAQETNEVSLQRDPRVLARALIGAMQSLNVMTRAGMDLAFVEDVKAGMFYMLE
jgi:TetR/AcrR family transcriptional regulator, transcriptional repressor for nem operon